MKLSKDSRRGLLLFGGLCAVYILRGDYCSLPKASPAPSARTSKAAKTLEGPKAGTPEAFSARKPLTEATKKQIYWEGFASEHRAMRAANAKYPIPDASTPGYSGDAVLKQLKANGEYSGKLIQQYDAELQKKFGITKQEYNAIIEEGMTNRWPKPTFAP